MLEFLLEFLVILARLSFRQAIGVIVFIAPFVTGIGFLFTLRYKPGPQLAIWGAASVLSWVFFIIRMFGRKMPDDDA